jgi:hypothetical protein
VTGRGPTYRQIEQVEHAIRDLILSAGTDQEIADDYGVHVDVVRNARRRLARDYWTREVMQAARELAEATGYEGPIPELVLKALRRATVRAMRSRAEVVR